MNNTNQLYQIAFSQLYGIGPIRARRILKMLNHPRDFFELSLGALQQITSIPIAQLEKTDRANALWRAQGQISYLSNTNLSYHFITDPTYPERLKNCPDAPLGLFYRGTPIHWGKQRFIAVVGTRQQTSYGRKLVADFISALPKDIVIISGLALGIDASVHQQCIDQQIKTIGVLGHGIDRIYPTGNRKLAMQMLESGGLLSEFLIGTKPDRMHFPMRNRIIAGLSDAIVVIESKKNGGSLITAELGNDYNREVFAFPGPIQHEQSEGCNALIQNHKAHLLTSTQDLLNMMNWANTKQEDQINQEHNLTILQKEILDLFKNKNNWSIDELVLSTQKAVSKVSSTLFELEIRGSLQNIGANRYRLPL